MLGLAWRGVIITEVGIELNAGVCVSVDDSGGGEYQKILKTYCRVNKCVVFDNFSSVSKVNMNIQAK